MVEWSLNVMYFIGSKLILNSFSVSCLWTNLFDAAMRNVLDSVLLQMVETVKTVWKTGARDGYKTVNS